MCRKLSLLTATALFLALPTRLHAGGPPWLCLPIDGQKADNTKATTDLLTAKLKDKLYPPEVFRGVAILDHANQSYATLFMKQDVGLGEIESALKSGGITVPRDRLRLFGYAILEIDPRSASPDELLAALKTLDHVSIANSETKDGRLLVTVDMPYPADEGRRGEAVGWDKFTRGDLSSDQSAKSEPPITQKSLPTYNTFRDVVAKHKATLKDIRWSTEYACRTVGGMAAPKPKTVAATNR